VSEGPSGRDPDCAIEQTLVIPQQDRAGEIAVEPSDLSDARVQIVAGAEPDLSGPRAMAPDVPTLFDIVAIADEKAATYRPGVVAESWDVKEELVDTSKWFEHNVTEPEDELADSQSLGVREETLSGPSFVSTSASTFDVAAAMDDYLSIAASVDEIADEQVEPDRPKATTAPRDERRRHPREESSDLVWIEYFNSSMECTGKEAARAENVGAGGMRLSVKNAPTELERLIVSYPFRGFESCSIVRSNYQDEDGRQHLCVQFVDREWNVSATGALVDHAAEKVARKLLLADDDAAFRKLLGNMLIRAGYEVVLAEDGQSAVEKTKTEKPDLVITDGLMPKLHGFQVCKAVKELNPLTGVIMLTAVYTTPNYIWDAKHKFRADEILTKPCQIADLLRKIEKHLPPVMSPNPYSD